jgi:hypothetical protein
MTRRLINQDAFDRAILHLLNQGHSCLSSSGQARYRGPRGKSAIGALIPDELYVSSMEGKKLQHWLAARGSEYDALRERFGSVTPSLLNDLQDLHDRSGACMPSLYRHLVLAGAQRIAQNFKLSMRLVTRSATYQHLRGPRIFPATVIRRIPAAPASVVPPAPGVAATPVTAALSGPQPAAAPATAALSTSQPAAAPATVANRATASALNGPRAAASGEAPTIDAPPVGELAAAPPVAASSVPESAAAPALAAPSAPQPAATPAPLPLPVHPQDELDLIARGIAKAIAAASGPSLDQRSGRR